MTDLKRHSEGIWRSIYIFEEVKEQWKIIEKVKEFLKELKLEEWSYCHYGEVKSIEPDRAEKAHVTFRINFPGTTSYDSFRKRIEKEKWKWEDHGYDEPLWVKKAYIIGTRLREEVLKGTKNPDVPLNKEFLRLMFHGFFNDIHYSHKDEVEFYLFMVSDYLRYLYGIKI